MAAEPPAPGAPAASVPPSSSGEGEAGDQQQQQQSKDYYKQGSTEVATETALTIKRLESVSCM